MLIEAKDKFTPAVANAAGVFSFSGTLGDELGGRADRARLSYQYRLLLMFDPVAGSALV